MTDVCTPAAAPKPEADDAEPALSGTTDVTVDIKICPVKVKTESDQSHDCLICASRIDEQWYDVYWTETRGGRSPLFAYICRVAEVRLTREAEAGASVACRTCVELINVLERAEIEYHRLKKSFVEIIGENPAFESVPQRDLKQVEVQVELVKREVEEDGVPASRTRTRGGARVRGRNSDDEPLALKKRGRKPGKRKKELREHTGTERTPDADKLDDGRVRKLSHRDPYPVLKDEDVSCDDFDWPEGAPESDDTDYRPATKKVKSKLKSLLENGHKQKSLRQKTKIKQVSIPVIGVIPAHLLVKDLESTNEWTECTEQAAAKEAIVRKQKKSTKQPKAHYPCKECASTFNSLSRLKFHMAKHEASKAPFICEICGAHYKHKKACDIHVDMHKGISDWKCEECNKLFPSKGALHRHNAIHTGKPNYQCDLCGKSFIHTSSFKMHKLSHTGLKPHACDVCGLALMTRSHLKRHKRIHSGEKRHECPVCGKRFSERYNLLAHQKSHDTPPVQGPPSIRKPWQGFRCHLCDKRFERRYILEKHMEVVHQRIMEKGPPKPRNTMTKLLKAQAAAVSKGSVSRDDADTPAGGLQQGSAQAASKSASSSAEDTSVDVKPLLTEKPADEDTHESGAGESSPQPARPAVSTGEGFGTVCLANGAWAAAAPYIAAEYSMRIAEYPQ